MKRITSLIVLTIMLLAVFSGCGEGEKTPVTAADTKAQPAQSGAATEKDAETAAETAEDTAVSSEPSVTEAPGPVKDEDFYGTYFGENGVEMTVNAGGSGKFTVDGVEYEALWMINEGELVIWDYGDHAFSGVVVQPNSELSGKWQHTEPMRFSADPSIVTAPVYPDPPYNPVVFKPVTVDLHDGLRITVEGAELFRDDEHGEAIRVYCDVENKSDESIKIYDEIITSLTWDVYDVAHCKNYNSAEAEAFNGAIAPGETVRFASEFVCSWDSEYVYVFEIKLEEYRMAEMFGATDQLEPGNYTVTAEFKMNELPAFPEGGLPGRNG